MFELAQRDANEVTDLRRTVDIDTGYLSRILARFESDGLISRQRSATDGRRQVIRLTDTGRGVVTGLGEPYSGPQTAPGMASSRFSDQSSCVLTRFVRSEPDTIAEIFTLPVCEVISMSPCASSAAKSLRRNSSKPGWSRATMKSNRAMFRSRALRPPGVALFLSAKQCALFFGPVKASCVGLP